jgi:hypothetical protein
MHATIVLRWAVFLQMLLWVCGGKRGQPWRNPIVHYQCSNCASGVTCMRWSCAVIVINSWLKLTRSQQLHRASGALSNVSSYACSGLLGLVCCRSGTGAREYMTQMQQLRASGVTRMHAMVLL